MMNKVYIPGVVQELIQFYGSILSGRHEFSSIRDHLYRLAAKMWEGIQNDVSCIKTEFNNYHPEYLGLDLESSLWDKLEFKDCLQAIASEYGYHHWDHVETAGNTAYDETMQSAVDHLIKGDLTGLSRDLDAFPEIINQPSQYGHRAKLIHYCGSNGVEMWRQQVPNNLPDIVRMLAEKGADMQASMEVYGGKHDVLTLARSSVHPVDAGINESLISMLKGKMKS